MRRAVVFVEGASDRAALEALAERRRVDLADRGISIVAIGGATNIGRHLAGVVQHADRVRIAGLGDIGEERAFRRGLERAGLGSGLDRAGMEQLGFYLCDADLEAELITALGAGTVEEVIAGEHELESFRIFQRQPAQRSRRVEDQLRRFLGTRSGRKTKYARLLVAALDLERVPRPLDGVLAYATR